MRISRYISNILANKGVIQGEDIEICRYGIECFILSVGEILSILLLSLIVGNFIGTLIYFIAFIPLRLYSGGYHANSKVGCYITLIAVYTLFSFIIRFFPQPYYFAIELISILLTAVAVIKFSPIIHINKTFANTEIAFFRKVSLGILLMNSVISVLGIIFYPKCIFLFAFSLGQLSVGISMFAAVVKNRMLGGENCEENKSVF